MDEMAQTKTGPTLHPAYQVCEIDVTAYPPIGRKHPLGERRYSYSRRGNLGGCTARQNLILLK